MGSNHGTENAKPKQSIGSGIMDSTSDDVGGPDKAGSASSYFPLNRGIDIDTSSVEAERATWTALFISSNAFASLPFIGTFIAQAVAAVNFAGLSNAQLVMVMTLLQWLENNQNYTNFHPLTPVYETFYKVTGL
jgi:hypothetical protein